MSDRINTSVEIWECDSESLPPFLRSVGARVFTFNELSVIVSKEPDGWHMSIAHRSRDPSWDELVTARYRLCGHVEEMAIYFPPLKEYVNVNPYCFHLYEVPRSRIIRS